MSKKVDRTTLQVFGTNARVECTTTALSHSVLAGVIGYNCFLFETVPARSHVIAKLIINILLVGVFLPLTLKYIKIIPITIQSQSLMALVGCGTLSLLVLKIEMAYCPPDGLSQKTTKVC